MGISNFKVSQVSDSSALLTWATDVDSSTEADIGIVDVSGNWAKERRRSGLPDTSDHSYLVSGLQAGSAYRAAAQSFDGNQSAAYLPVDDGSCPSDFTTAAGTLVGDPPSVSAPTADSVTVSWQTASPGVGYVIYRANGGIDLQAADDNQDPATSHSVSLDDLVAGTAYTCHYETDLEDSEVTVISAPFTFTTQASAAVPVPGHVGIGAQPCRLPVGGTSTISVQVVKRDGTPQSGIPVAFSLGAGKAEGSLSAPSATTDASGRCHVAFIVTSLPAGRKKARRAVLALVGAAGGKQKRRHAVVIGMKA